MSCLILKQSFARAKDGRIVSVEDVARGLACDCICPGCAAQVMSRQGDVREWHFAHVSGADCAGAAETALHLAAKQLLLESAWVGLPAKNISRSVALPDGRHGHGQASFPLEKIDFEGVQCEQSLGDIRPDIVGYETDRRWLIEIAVTHLVDEEKNRHIQLLGDPAIEIRLNPKDWPKWNWEILRQEVLLNRENRYWLHFPWEKELEFKAEKEAIANAELLPTPRPPQVVQDNELLGVFRVKKIFVRVIRYPFGIVVKSHYDPEVNELIKPIIRAVRGKWMPAYRTWLVPSGYAHGLLMSLEGIGKRV